jgi:hypothetical protein
MTMTMEDTSDFIWGAKRIAEFFRDVCGIAGANAKMVYNWYERGGAIPISKAPHNGKLFVSRNAVLGTLNRAVDAALARCAVVDAPTPAPAVASVESLGKPPRARPMRPSGEAIAAKGGKTPGRRGPRANFRGR